MAEIGTALSVAQTLIAALEFSGLKGVMPVLGYKSDLKDLKKTVKTVESVLLDVGNKSTLSETELDFIKSLKDVLYDADDLFDKYLTLNELKDGKLSAKEVQVRFPYTLRNSDRQTDWESIEKEQGMMGKLQPHPNLVKFELHEYRGEYMRWWRAEDDWAALLPKLVYVKLSNCRWLNRLPILSRLLYLKSLHLYGLEKLEFVEETVPSGSGEITFFRYLESLEIYGFTKLKEWWRGSSSNLHCQPDFPRLSQLTITGCPDLTSFPACPDIQTLSLRGNNEALRITTTSGVHASSSFGYYGNSGLVAELDHVDHLKSLAPRLLTSLYTSNDNKTESLSEVEEVFKYCSSFS